MQIIGILSLLMLITSKICFHRYIDYHDYIRLLLRVLNHLSKKLRFCHVRLCYSNWGSWPTICILWPTIDIVCHVRMIKNEARVLNCFPDRGVKKKNSWIGGNDEMIDLGRGIERPIFELPSVRISGDWKSAKHTIWKATYTLVVWFCRMNLVFDWS